ncbi:MAG: DUF3883 domain-containing protein [Chloroflexi bacterium]|nr:DUF3883 domain-containing protein [Chloroflexota bacterium]
MEEGYLSLGVEYLGFLNGQLRDLRGYITLANELIQNADDVPGATEIIFDVCDDALVVENDGVFSDCEHMQHSDCPWLREPDKGYRCDFHRFRLTASGDKRRQSNTTGAFGIGFIAVYQITDQPEVMSKGRHWIICPEQVTERRIKVQQPIGNMVGTRFRFPWAMDADTGIRKELGVEPMNSKQVTTLLNELERALPSSLLFLRNLSQVKLKHNGHTVKEIERIQEKDEILIEEKSKDDTSVSHWHLFHSDFDEKAKDIRSRVGGQIEEKRSSKVIVAIPKVDVESGNIQGFFHAYLPTQHPIGLPLHINADFYPSSDRKRILFEQDYQGEWNASAVQAAARAVARALPDLPEILEHKGLWQLLDDVRELARDAENGSKESVLQSFWHEMKRLVGRLPLVYTSRERWQQSAQVCLLQSRDKEEPCLPVLEKLNLDIVHPDLTPYSNVLRDREVGVKYLSAEDLAQGLKGAGLDRTMRLEDAPNWIQSIDNREILSNEIDLLLSRSPTQEGLGTCAIACSVDGWLCSPDDLRKAGSDIRIAFDLLEPSAIFAADDNPKAILGLVPEFGVTDALDILETSSPDDLQSIWKGSPKQFVDLLYWFAERPAQVRSDPQNVKRLQHLSVWPSGDELYSSGHLVIPGGFQDRLQLTNVVDPRVVERCGDFLTKELDASVLTLETYVIEHVPRAFESDKGVSERACRELTMILAENLGKIRDNYTAREVLSFCPIVECTDGRFRTPGAVYFDCELVADILGDDHVSIASIPEHNQEAVKELFKWLGVTDVPRPEMIIARIAGIVVQPPDEYRSKVIQQIFTKIGIEWSRAFEHQQHRFARLRQMAWLPAEGDAQQWYEPVKVYDVFRRHLFATQARFLDVPQQGRTTAFMKFLEIPGEPETTQVVRHLLQAVKNSDFGLNKQVYTFLNDDKRVNAPEIAILKDAACLLLEGDQYVHPRKVFWGEHPFGKYRFRLSDEFRAYGRLLDQLDVKDSPEPEDAIEVLLEISEEYGSNKSLDDDVYNVLMQCWSILDDALEHEEILEDALSGLWDVKVIPDDRKLLNSPRRMYFEDRPGLKEKFGTFLQHNAIPRPQGAWQAMKAAGVLPLSQAVTTELVECVDPAFSNDLQNRLKNRSHLIARVLAAQKNGNWEQYLLERLEPYRAQRLVLTYTIKAYNRTDTSPAEDTLAYFDPEDECIYFVGNANISWAAIARELAYALNPLGEAGQIAPGIKEVLRSDSMESAEQELSELGFAPLQTLGYQAVPDSVAIAPGGTDLVDDIGLGREDGEGDVETPTPDADEVDTTKGDDVELPSRAPRGDGDQTKGDKPSTKKKIQGRLATYVFFTDESDQDEEKDEDEKGVDIERIRRIDRAGVDRVLAFEKEAGRIPKEMPHEHPGYDIESLDEFGQVARYIEVKSTANEWGKMGVGLTGTQFKKAQKLGNRYWLYVVENAEGEESQVYPIHNPANKVNRFLYDGGWRAVSSLEEELATSKRRSIVDLKKQ